MLNRRGKGGLATVGVVAALVLKDKKFLAMNHLPFLVCAWFF